MPCAKGRGKMEESIARPELRATRDKCRDIEWMEYRDKGEEG